MQYSYRIILIVLILNPRKIKVLALAQTELVSLVALASDVKNFYKSSSVIIVNDKYMHDWDFKHGTFTVIREFSRLNVMSQVIGYDSLNATMNLQIEINQSTVPLFMLYVHNTKSLKHFRRLMRGRKMSMFTWLVFIDDEANVDCEYPKGNPFNLEMDTRMIVKCEGNMSIKKYYSIFDNETEVVDLATWTPGEKLVLKSDDNLLQMKKNMRGITLRIAKYRHSSNDMNKNIADYLDKLVNTLANVSNFKKEVVIEDDKPGYLNKTSQQWVGLMKSMNEKKADIAEVLFSMSNHRMSAVDFAMPLMRVQVQIYAKLPDKVTIRWSAYFQVFNMHTWVAIGLHLLFFSIFLALAKSTFIKPYITTNSFFENFISVMGIYCQQGVSEISVNTPLQMMYFSILISSMILYAVYSATITSYIAVLTTDLPFATYEEFLQQKDYKLVIIQDSREQYLIYTDDWLLAPLKARLKSNNELPTNAYDGFLQACNDNVAFYADEVLFDGISENIPCTLGSFKMSRIQNQAIALAKDSPYTETINYYILRLLNHGILSRLKRKYLYKFTKLPENKPNIISLREITPILTIWTVGVMTSLIIFCMEILYCRQHSLERNESQLSQRSIAHLFWQKFNFLLCKKPVRF